MNISVPDELAEQVRTLKIPISETCQRALRNAVESATLRDTSGMSEITVEVGDPPAKVGFIGRWLIEPDPGRHTLGGMYYGVALTQRGRIAVYAAHAARALRAALNDFDSLSEAEKSGALPSEAASVAAGRLATTEDRVIWRDI